jgi:hypothetical protein
MSDPLQGVALGIARGQLAQAARWLLVAQGLVRRPGDPRDPLLTALQHLRSATGWLETAARQR